MNRPRHYGKRAKPGTGPVKVIVFTLIFIACCWASVVFFAALAEANEPWSSVCRNEFGHRSSHGYGPGCPNVPPPMNVGAVE